MRLGEKKEEARNSQESRDESASMTEQEGACHVCLCAALDHIWSILWAPWQGHCHPMVTGETEAQRG